MAGSGFRVDPDQLLAVADQVARLREDLSGDSGAAGNMQQYAEQTNAKTLRNALSSFWVGDDVFADAYGIEQMGVLATMSSMVGQLQALEAACRNTASQYSAQDQNSRTDVRRTDPGARS